MANVKFLMGDTDGLNSVTKTPGQLLITKDKPYLELWADYIEDGDSEVTRKKLDVDKGVDITWAEYQQLSHEEKNSDIIFFITDRDPAIDVNPKWTNF